MSANEVQILGTGLASLMSMAQLGAAVALFDSLSTAIADRNTISLTHLRQAFFNHVKACLRMPAGGAMAGGSMQTGFEMELVSTIGIGLLMAGWPNHESLNNGRRRSWELRTMEELAAHLKLETQGWGALMGKPMAIKLGRTTHGGVLLAAPPFTVSWGERDDGTTWLCCRFPVVLWTEEDAAILPPDTTSEAGPTPFYLDPVDQPVTSRGRSATSSRRGGVESRGSSAPGASRCRRLSNSTCPRSIGPTRGLFRVLNGGGA